MDLLSAMIDLAVYLIIIITPALLFGQIHAKLSVLGLLVGIMVVMMIAGQALQLIIVSALASIVIIMSITKLREAEAEAE